MKIVIGNISEEGLVNSTVDEVLPSELELKVDRLGIIFLLWGGDSANPRCCNIKDMCCKNGWSINTFKPDREFVHR